MMLPPEVNRLRAWPTLTLVGIALLTAAPYAAAREESVAFVGARLVPAAAPEIPRGTLLVRDGKIAAIGREVAVPAAARRVDLRGKTVIPGLVDAHSSLFLPAAELAGPGAADRDILDAVDFYTRDAEQVLARGVTTLYLSPGRNGNINGLGAVVRLEGPDADQPGMTRVAVLKRRAALKLTLGVSTTNRSASLERLASYEALRSAFRSAQQYAKSFERYERERQAYEAQQKAPGSPAAAQPGTSAPAAPSRPTRPRRVPSQEVLVAALQGEIPVRLEAHREDDIRNALRLADEFKLRVILERATEGRGLAGEIAKRAVGVVWGPSLLEGPPRLETRRHDAGSAAALSMAKVRLAVTPGGSGPLASRFVLENAAAACGSGLSKPAALRAVTLDAAELLGVNERTGSLAPGKEADLVVLSGSPWDPLTRIESVYVAGREVYRAR